jgi:MFS transporter, ACDE family, multidrug resistance protein
VQNGSSASTSRQPKAVYAVAFACVVSFMGIGLAPFAAGELAERWDLHVPFVVGAVAVVLAVAVLSTGHQMLARADAELATGHGDPDGVAGEVADEFGGAPGAIDQEVEPELAARRKTAARS